MKITANKANFGLAKVKFVPDHYVGLWQRTLFENSDGQDTTSTVLWMQTYQQHADIRIPAERPDFSGCENLQECAPEQLRWLATQQGFLGYTHVQNSVCEWRREIDFQPENDTRDIADMVFDDESTLLETGIDTKYLERWKKLENSDSQSGLQITTGMNRHGETVTAYLLSAGDYLAYVRPRSVDVPNASDLLSAIDLYQPSHETLLDWLDMEISFGQLVEEQHWQVLHSTLPFLEGNPRAK